MAFSSGKYAIGACDHCSRVVKYNSLVEQLDDRGEPLGLWVCDRCYDKPNPQARLDEIGDVSDAIGLEHPRPFPQPEEGLQAWNPVGGLSPMRMEMGQYFGG